MTEKTDAIVKIIADSVTIDPFAPYKILTDSESIGTGFFINNSGFVLTCAHVVENCLKIWINVPTRGKDKIDAVIHSICYDKDLALLKTIDYKNVSYCELGDSDKIISGDTVIALGYPLGQTRVKMTKGVISGRQDKYIQTDTSINPGNSGGPLIDKNKKVIGINTSKISSSNTEGVGYATPIHDFIVIRDAMINQTAKIIREPQMYFGFQTTDANHCKLFNCPDDAGILVKYIIEDSPLYIAGLRRNDIILKFDGQKLDGFGDLNVSWSNDKINIEDVISRYTQTSVIPFEFWSSKQKKKILTNVTFDNNTLIKVPQIYYPFQSFDYEVFCGMVVMELTYNHLIHMSSSDIKMENRIKLKKYSKTKNRMKSVLFIASILHGTYLSSIDDVTAGDIITVINANTCETLDDFRKAIVEKSFNLDKDLYSYMKLDSEAQIVINISKAYADESELSQRYKYKISTLYDKLCQQ
jgi:S1-C subfamily serine protease